MPRISDDKLDVAIYLYSSVADAECGSEAGATGFAFIYPFKKIPEVNILCIVTNRHVVDDFPVPRVNMKDGSPPDCIQLRPCDWFKHDGPHDLAVAVGCLNADVHKIQPMPAHKCLTREKAQEYVIGVGDEVYMIGRFIGHDGKVHNEPTARFGNISAAVRPMRNTRTNDDEESFAVEMHTKPGYSGSPTLVYASVFQQVYKNIRPKDKVTFEFLLGVNWGQIFEKVPLLDKDGRELHASHVLQPSGMNGVVPSWHLLDLMEQKNVQQAIERFEKKVLKRRSKQRAVAKPNAAHGESEPDNPSHKEDFDRLLDAAARTPMQGDQT